jgi:hypothetical protein
MRSADGVQLFILGEMLQAVAHSYRARRSDKNHIPLTAPWTSTPRCALHVAGERLITELVRPALMSHPVSIG